MAKEVTPQVFIIAETKCTIGVGYFLEALGVKHWETDAHSSAEKLTEIAGKSCYMSFDLDHNKNLTRVGTRNNHDYIQQQIIAARHGSVLEHATVTLAFVNVSRVFTHELVRHRVGAAYSQVSGRYVRTDEINYFLPSAIKAQEDGAEFFYEAFKEMEGWTKMMANLFNLDDMKDFKLKKILTSAIRRLIGNGQANHIIVTMNHRTLRHVIEMRTNRGAEEEIRLAFAEVFDLVSKASPAFYSDAVITRHDGINEIVFPGGRV